MKIVSAKKKSRSVNKKNNRSEKVKKQRSIKKKILRKKFDGTKEQDDKVRKLEDEINELLIILEFNESEIVRIKSEIESRQSEIDKIKLEMKGMIKKDTLILDAYVCECCGFRNKKSKNCQYESCACKGELKTDPYEYVIDKSKITEGVGVCQKCQFHNEFISEVNKRFCLRCGEKLLFTMCSECSTYNGDENETCIYCNTKLREVSGVENVDLEKEKKEKKLRETWAIGDGYCSLHAVIMAYLIKDENNKFLVSSKKGFTKSDELPTDPLTNYRRIIYNYLRDKITFESNESTLVQMIELANQVAKKEIDTVESEYLFTVLSDILKTPICVYQINKDGKTYIKTIYNKNNVDEKNTIYIKTTRGHYNPLVDANLKTFPKNASIWRKFMLDILSKDKNRKSQVKKLQESIWAL